jgi:peptidyl-prolyl cis-trans isomerase C
MKTGRFSILSAPLAVFAAFAALAQPALAADLAKVNGKTITDRDLQIALSNLNEGQRATALKDPNTRRQVLTGVIEQEVLVQEAEKAKLDADKEYKEALNAFRRQYLASRVLQKNLGSKFTDSAAKKYYDKHKSRFSTEQVRAMHILIRDEKKANEVFAKVKGLGDDEFMAEAEKISEDPSAKNNRGDLGYFGHDRMTAEFSNAAFAGLKGEVIGPVKTDYGYHIIRVVDKKVGKVMGYDEVELRVKNELRQELTKNYLGELRKQAKVQVDDKAVDKL